MSRDQQFQPQVWLCPLTEWELPAPHWLSWLDAHERARLERFKHADAARRFLLARVVLKSTVAALEQVAPESIRLDYSPNGKPFLPGTGRPHFSISHSNSTVAVALAPFDLGIDVELIQRRSQPWRRPEAFLHPDEAAQVVAQPSAVAQALAFTQRWACQEAAVKLKDSSVFNTNARISFEENVTRGVCAKQRLCFSSWLPNPETGSVQPLPEVNLDNNAALPADAMVLSLATAQPLPQVDFGRWQL